VSNGNIGETVGGMMSYCLGTDTETSKAIIVETLQKHYL